MNLPRILLLAATSLAPALAMAQWQWIDGAGRRVYSDQPPPIEIPQKNILRQPSPRGVTVVPSEPAPPAAAAPAAPRTPPAAAKAPDARTQPADAAEAEKRKAEEERVARLRADNCTRAQQSRRALESGMRMARLNDKGEQEILDDTARAAELRRVQEIIASDCKAP